MSDEKSYEEWEKELADIPASVIAVESMEMVAEALRLHVSDIPDYVTRDELKQSLVDTTELLITLVTALKRVTVINRMMGETTSAIRNHIRRAAEERDGKVEDHSGSESAPDERPR